MIDGLSVSGRFVARCLDAEGVERWRCQFPNAVVNQGVQTLLQSALLTGMAAPQWYVGLKGEGDVVLTDTLAAKGWAEVTAYVGASRPAWTREYDAASGSVKSSADVVFKIDDRADVYGAFIASSAGKLGTDGLLYSAANFPAPYPLYPGDTLIVQYATRLRRA